MSYFFPTPKSDDRKILFIEESDFLDFDFRAEIADYESVSGTNDMFLRKEDIEVVDGEQYVKEQLWKIVRCLCPRQRMDLIKEYRA